MPVGLKERLLGEVFGIVVVADAVVAVGVDVPQVAPVELGEAGVELQWEWLGGEPPRSPTAATGDARPGIRAA